MHRRRMHVYENIHICSGVLAGKEVCAPGAARIKWNKYVGKRAKAAWLGMRFPGLGSFFMIPGAVLTARPAFCGVTVKV